MAQTQSMHPLSDEALNDVEMDGRDISQNMSETRNKSGSKKVSKGSSTIGPIISPIANFRSQKKPSVRLSRDFFMDQALSSNNTYMNVIKESHESVSRRKHLERTKRRILNLDTSKRRNHDMLDMSDLNNFI